MALLEKTINQLTKEQNSQSINTEKEKIQQ